MVRVVSRGCVTRVKLTPPSPSHSQAQFPRRLIAPVVPAQADGRFAWPDASGGDAGSASPVRLGQNAPIDGLVARGDGVVIELALGQRSRGGAHREAARTVADEGLQRVSQ